MSAKAGTFEGTRRQTSWTGAWIAAVLLTVIVVVTLFAVNASSGETTTPVGRAPTFEVGDQLSGGPAGGAPSRTTQRGGEPASPAQPGIRIGDTICHQCR
jgi:hypothetical protein